ncbi:tRNA (adenosine(37)-N6)-threonylcarbamoyltransferase complex transferase subunit TsaD [Desulfatirhabdium butyrativorans]|uniref:tRNA (adenosine(37)-N6)-threonylcarbamoyltransferase complex transferase subunit TsaD n=1 Tax=Desulfatirhabdium butyrativorans TaxID=340467 RepID=UPI0004012D49|nr:tRNA (adenosine(37)-N6)-threonylcarbamoyltransferase complex transferase subunit TsaD [Desulfatirhabdium butyrativorans]
MKILGIETSCDETAAAVVENATVVRSSVVASQIADHHPYGGVVPELASRKHLEAITPVVAAALQQAGIAATGLDAIAVTRGPGLVGALLVGFSFAKAMAVSLNLPWIGINHLEGHIQALFLSETAPSFPFIVLLASGGHTSIYKACSPIEMIPMGRTLDDAAGEAFDKVAKLLGLGYPGGAVIEKTARNGNPKSIPFPRTYLDKTRFDFSFSGLKTAVRRYVQTHGTSSVEDIVASFQEAACEVMVQKLVQAAVSEKASRIAIVGGVAANSRLRQMAKSEAEKHGLDLFIPEIAYCGDNAAMIASAGFHRLMNGERSSVEDDVFSR